MANIITNAFSLNMLSGDRSEYEVSITRISPYDAAIVAGSCVSAVGHADTAAVFSDALGVPIAYNRTTVTLRAGSRVLVGQYRGPRLPEGATRLPEGAAIDWFFVEVRGG